MIALTHIPTDIVPTFWGIAEPLLAKAVKRYRRLYGMDEVHAAILDGSAALWLVVMDGKPVAAMTTTEVIYPRQKTLLIELVGGANASLWYYDTVKQLSKVAKDAGYDSITSTARAGWCDMAKDAGFKETAVVYELEL